MKTKDFFRKIFSVRLWANLAGMLLVVVLLCLGVKIGIDIYTHHGEVIMVPDVKRKQFADAEHILAANGLGVVVSDTGYVKTLPPDCILEQSPEPGRGVKSECSSSTPAELSRQRKVRSPYWAPEGAIASCVVVPPDHWLTT